MIICNNSCVLHLYCTSKPLHSVSFVGTSIDLKKDNILLLEDINEKSYAIHRNLVQLKNAGIFECIEAIIFGDFTKGDEFVEQAIKSFCLNHIPHIEAYKADGIGMER